MTSVVIPNTIVPGQPENVLQVTENWQAVVSKLRGNLENDNFAAAGIQKADLLNRETAYPRPIWQASGWRTDLEVTNERLLGMASTVMPNVGVTLAYQQAKLCKLAAADFAVAGASPQLRMRVALNCNAYAGWNDTQTNPLTLKRITAVSGTGSSMFTTLGSATLTVDPGAGSQFRSSSLYSSAWLDFGSITAGLYVVTHTPSLAPPTGGCMLFTVSLEVSWT